MRILHTVEYYAPNVGGAQEVVRQISRCLAARGHQVTVATSFDDARQWTSDGSVAVRQFGVAGNHVNGYTGDVGSYIEFLTSGQFDVMMNYAAQQWSADLAYPLLRELPYATVLTPCGFSQLGNPGFREYYSRMPGVLANYDRLVFHASNYQDANMARRAGILALDVIPNGASDEEFDREPTGEFRSKYGIPAEHPLIVTIGTHTGLKGHSFAIDAFARAETGPATLVIIGNQIRQASPVEALRSGRLRMFAGLLRQRLLTGPGCYRECQRLAHQLTSRSSHSKRVLVLDLPRALTVEALLDADLFLFCSQVEYSPIVLFEAMASRTPFLTATAGNAEEIARWSGGGGEVIPGQATPDGRVVPDMQLAGKMIEGLLRDKRRAKAMGESGYAAWKRGFTWKSIASLYERCYEKAVASAALRRVSDV